MIRKLFVTAATAGLMIFGMSSGPAWAGGGSGETPEYWDQEAARYHQYAVEYQAKADELQAKAEQMQANGEAGFEKYLAKAQEMRGAIEHKLAKAAEFKARADALRAKLGAGGGSGGKGSDDEFDASDLPKDMKSEEMKEKAKAKAAEAKARAMEEKAKHDTYVGELKKYSEDIKADLQARAEAKKARIQKRCEKMSRMQSVMASNQEKAQVALDRLKTSLAEADEEEAVKIQKKIDILTKHMTKSANAQAKFNKVCTTATPPVP